MQVPPVAWDRRRLVAMLAAARVVLGALLAGVGMTVWYAVGGSPTKVVLVRNESSIS